MGFAALFFKAYEFNAGLQHNRLPDEMQEWKNSTHIPNIRKNYN
jgi:hypothetical protein